MEFKLWVSVCVYVVSLRLDLIETEFQSQNEWARKLASA